MVPRAMEPGDCVVDAGRGQRSSRQARDSGPPERAFAFLSRSFVEAQRGAEFDLKLITARTKSLQKIVATPPSLDDWEKIRIPLSGGKEGKDVTAGELLRQLKDSGRRALEASSKPIVLDEWEKIRIPEPLSGGKDLTAGELVKQLQDSGRRALESPKPLSLDELEVVKSIQKRIPPALTKLQKRFPGSLPAAQKTRHDLPPNARDHSSPFALFPDAHEGPSFWSQAGWPQAGFKSEEAKDESDEDWASKLQLPWQAPQWQWKEDGKKGALGAPPLLRPFEGKQFISLADWNKAVKEHKWKLPVPGPGTHWEPLKIVAEGLKELQEQSGTGAEDASKPSSPQEAFMELLKKKVVPRLPAPLQQSQFRETAPAPPGTDVAPLALPEVIEVLARTSEEVLGSLGVNQDVSSKVSHALRRCKDVSQRLAGQVGQGGAQDLASAQGGAEGGAHKAESLDARLEAVMESTGYQHKEDGTNSIGELLQRCQAVISGTPASAREQRGDRRSVAIVTTASLPWMTGTAVNPLLRAAYLAQSGEQLVTLLVPWLSKEDQVAVYPGNITFDTPAEQEAYVRDWLSQRIGFQPEFKIKFYPGMFSREKRSIFAVGDITKFVPDSEADIAVLEEPEHLTWYFHGKRWTDKFQHVVGIIHTNYLEYIKREKNGVTQAAILEHFNKWLVRAYCHKVVRLSAATQEFPRSEVCNVHGVGVKFLDVGDAMAAEQHAGRTPFSKGAYYLGKMVWSKGYRELVDLLHLNYNSLGSQLKVDVYGSGEDSEAVRREADAKGLKLQFYKGRDHADTSLHQYKVFINPSVSDVVCTTTAEALAMGKIVVCADHPSNEFFRTFPNCLIYKTPQEFVEKVQQAMASEPQPLTREQRHLLTWEAATQRFLRSAGLDSLAKAPTPDSLPFAPAALESPAAGTRSAASGAAGLGTAAALAPGNAAQEIVGGIERERGAVRRARSWDDLQSLGRGLGVHPRQLRAKASPASLSLSLSVPDLSELIDRFLSFSHFVASGNEGARMVVGAPPDSMHIGAELSKEMGLPPPWVQRPTYGW